MLSEKDLKQWLMENGGPAIRLQATAEPGLHDSCDKEKLVHDVLQTREAAIVLGYLDAFANLQSRDPKTLEHLIHYYKESSIENFFPRLIDLGLRAGTPVLDEKMLHVRELLRFLYSENIFYSFIIASFLFMAGYAYNEMVEFVKSRIDALHKAATERISDVYLGEAELERYPKRWADKPVVRPELNPITGEKPLPFIHDLTAMAFFPPQCLDTQTKAKIDDIVGYILSPAIQGLPEGYGLLWHSGRRVYHACGWSPTLPWFYGFDAKDYDRAKYNNWRFLYFIERMSQFEAACNTEWFRRCMDRIENFRTEKGTYIFPQEYLNFKCTEAVVEAYLGKPGAGLKLNEKKALVYELYSTLFALKIRERMRRHFREAKA